MIALHKCDSTLDVLQTSQNIGPGSQSSSAVCSFPFTGIPDSLAVKSTRHAAPLSIHFFQLLAHYTISRTECQHLFVNIFVFYPYFQENTQKPERKLPLRFITFFNQYQVLRKRDRKFLVSCFWGLPKTSSGAPSSQMTPSFMYTTRLLTSRAKAISWVTTSMVMPS